MTRRRLLSGLALVTVLLAGACGKGTVPRSPAASTRPAGMTVTLVRAGGLLGVHDEVVVADNGGWTVTDRSGNHRSGQLTGQQRDALRQLVTDPHLRAEAVRSRWPAHCADVYEYQLTVNGTVRISYPDCPNDTDIPKTAAQIVAVVTRSVWG